MPHQTAYI